MTNSKQAENYGKNADGFPETPGFIDFLFEKTAEMQQIRVVV